MHGIWLENQTPSYREDLSSPVRVDEYALVEVELAGICSTDLELINGYYPFTGILGHEFVGTVIDAGQHSDLLGKRVVGEINISCGECRECKAQRKTHCLNRNVFGIHNFHGAFADQLILPLENLHIVPPTVSERSAVFTEPLAAAVEITKQHHIDPDDQVLVVGAGRLGLLVAQVLRLTGASISVVIRRSDHEGLIHGWGVSTIWVDQVPPGYFDLVVDTTGSQDGFRLARKAVRPRGTLVVKSTYAGDLTLDMSSIVVDEINLVGSRCGPFKPAINLLEKELIETESLITATYPLKNALEALEHAGKPGVLKILLEIG